MRAKLTVLMIVAVCLISGMRSDVLRDTPELHIAPTARDAESASAAHAAPEAPRFSAEAIEAVLGDQNRLLSGRELSRIATAVLTSSERYDLDPQLVTAVILVESGARPWARSPKGAVGLMQVMPRMAAHYGLAGNLAHIESNVELGCLILADNIRRWGEEDGISAYFWGPRIRGAAYLNRVLEVRERIALSES